MEPDFETMRILLDRVVWMLCAVWPNAGIYAKTKSTTTIRVNDRSFKFSVTEVKEKGG